jgi:CheY-like chemotaxis protein
MGSANETVYIVDDDPAVRETLASLLRANGKRVRLFTSGAEFLSLQREDAWEPWNTKGLLRREWGVKNQARRPCWTT